MVFVARAQEPSRLPSRFPGQGQVAASCRGLRLRSQPEGQHVAVPDGPQALLKPLQKRFGFGAGVRQLALDLDDVAQPAGADAETMQGVGVVAIPQAVEALDDRAALRVTGLPEAPQGGLAIRFGPVGKDVAQVPAELGDLHVHQTLGHAHAAPPNGTLEAAPKAADLSAGFRPLGRLSREELEADVEIPAGSSGASESLQDRKGARHALGLRVPGEVRQRHPEPPTRHSHVVNALGVAAESLWQVQEEHAHALAEERGRGVELSEGRHRNIAGPRQTTTEIREASSRLTKVV